jgi:hypothetical protein
VSPLVNLNVNQPARQTSGALDSPLIVKVAAPVTSSMVSV